MGEAWFRRFAKAMKNMSYSQSQGDHTLFIKHSEKGRIIALIAYVDDIMVTGDDLEEMEKLKKKLANEFKIKDLRRLKYLLGIKVAHSKEVKVISLQKYTLNLLKETEMLRGRPANTSIEPNHKLDGDKEHVSIDREKYQ